MAELMSLVLVLLLASELQGSFITQRFIKDTALAVRITRYILCTVRDWWPLSPSACLKVVLKSISLDQLDRKIPASGLSPANNG